MDDWSIISPPSPWYSKYYTLVMGHSACFSFVLRSHWELSSDGMCWLHFRKTARFVVKTCIKYRYQRLLSEQRIALSCQFPWATHLGTSFEENIGNVFGLIVNDNQNHDDVTKWKHFPRYWHFVAGEFPSQRPATRSFDVFFDLRLNKHSRRRRLETPSCSLWRHCDVVNKYMYKHGIRQNGILAERLDYHHSHADVLKWTSNAAVNVSSLPAWNSCWTNSEVAGDIRLHLHCNGTAQARYISNYALNERFQTTCESTTVVRSFTA